MSTPSSRFISTFERAAAASDSGRSTSPAGLTEPGVAADGVSEVAEHAAGLHRHPDEDGVQVVFADHRARPAGGAAGQVALLHENDLPCAHPGEVHGDARAVDAASYDDSVGGFGVHGHAPWESR